MPVPLGPDAGKTHMTAFRTGAGESYSPLPHQHVDPLGRCVEKLKRMDGTASSLWKCREPALMNLGWDPDLTGHWCGHGRSSLGRIWLTSRWKWQSLECRRSSHIYLCLHLEEVTFRELRSLSIKSTVCWFVLFFSLFFVVCLFFGCFCCYCFNLLSERRYFRDLHVLCPWQFALMKHWLHSCNLI